MNKLYIFDGPKLTNDQIQEVKLEAFGRIDDEDVIISGKFADDDEWFLSELLKDKLNDNDVTFAGYDPEDHEIVYNSLTLDSVIYDICTEANQEDHEIKIQILK